ncbi:MAG: hypothetical protein AAB621_01200 [Patescibacteria group bacterium]
MSQRHRNKDKKENQMRVPEIFKDLWGFDFIEDIGFAKVKNEMPKIRITVARENEGKIEMIKTLLQKYEFPFSNLKIVISGDKKESETNTAGHHPSIMLKANKIATKPTMGKLGERKLPPFKCI